MTRLPCACSPTDLARPYLLLFTYLRPYFTYPHLFTFISCPYGIPRRSSLRANDGIVTVAVCAASTGSAPATSHLNSEIIVDSSTGCVSSG